MWVCVVWECGSGMRVCVWESVREKDRETQRDRRDRQTETERKRSGDWDHAIISSLIYSVSNNHEALPHLFQVSSPQNNYGPSNCPSCSVSTSRCSSIFLSWLLLLAVWKACFRVGNCPDNNRRQQRTEQSLITPTCNKTAACAAAFEKNTS